MEPFLAVFADSQLSSFIDLHKNLEKNTPVDFLVITEKSGENITYRYTTPEKIFNDMTEIQNDYGTILFIGDIPNHQSSIQNQTVGPVICFVDAIKKTVSSSREFDEDLIRYLSINGFQVFINQKHQKCIGLTVSEFETLVEATCLQNREELDKMLRAEEPLYLSFSQPNLTPFLFLQKELTPHTRGVVQLQNNIPPNEKLSTLPIFIMRTPDLALWVYAKPFATLGSLTFDLQKFLKEVGQVKEAIKSGAFSQSSGLNEQNLLFMDDFSPDNELELTFNMDTMRAELESKATKQGFQLLGERISKSARLLLLKKID
jgi:hypothetical protein